jgi:hypothetical protein
MRHFLLCLLSFGVLGGASANAQYHQTTGPNGFQCSVPVGGMSVLAGQVDQPGPYFALSAWLPGPVIFYDTKFYSLGPGMQRLTQYHECAHLSIPTTNEFVANCYALIRMLDDGTLTPPAQVEILNAHCNMGPLPMQYGGSGVAFWTGTLSVKACQKLATLHC